MAAAKLPANTTAMSIHVEGLWSYADTGILAEVQPIKWQLDGSNRIELYNTTSGARTGRFDFIQEAAGVTDFVSTGDTYYSPGVNQAFSVASRNGATFINGANEGNALTENSTPTALPDLSSTDLDIFPTGAAFVSLIRIWGADIGDAGLTEATS